MENIGFKYNWGKFYWDAWLNDINLQSCDLAAQGLWINLIAIMHKSEKIGYLVINGRPMTVVDIAKRVGIRKDRAERLLKKLIENDVCSVNNNGILFCRRIVREERRRHGVVKSNHEAVCLKKDDNQANSNAVSVDYRHISQGEQDVISEFSSCIDTKRKTISIPKYISTEIAQYKGSHQIKYDVVGVRLPQEWFPNDVSYQYAVQLQLCPEEVVEDFRDYWHAKSGKEAVKMDWEAAWRRWCRVASQLKQKDKKN